MKIIRCCASGLIGGMMAGCSYSPVLQSVPADRGQSGLIYALPKAQFQLDVVRKIVSAQDVADAQKANDDAAAALVTADKTVADAKGALAVAQSNVDAVAATDPPGTKDKLANDLAVATILVRARVAEADVAKIRAAEAEKRLAQVKANQGKLEQSVALKPLAAVPDHRHRYAIQHMPSTFRDDILKLTAANGMLNSTVSESTGQAGALIVNLASSIAGLKSPPRVAMLDLKSPGSGCKPFSLSRTFDPTDMTEVKATAEALYTESQDALQLVHEGQEVAAAAAQQFAASAMPTTAAPTAPVAVASKAESSVSLQGLAYRAPRLARIEVKGKDSGVCASVTKPSYASLAATVPDSSTMYVLPVEAGNFTKSKVEYAFKDGMPTTFNIDRPSQAVAAARVPVDILKAIVEVPASILKLRVDYDSSANALADAELKNLKAQLDLLKAQQALDEARSSE